MKALRVYKSSAGSGKTFTLVLEYLLLVVKNPAAFRQILAVTFTNKAANELKERILKGLFELSTAQENPVIQNVILPYLIQQSGLDESEIRRRATLVFHQILHQYSDFNVSTIDSFVQRLSRTFARELGLPSRYEVLLESDAMIKLAADLTIEQVGVDDFLTKLILNFVKQKLDDEDDWRFEKKLVEFMQLLLQEEAHRYRQGNELDTHEKVQQLRTRLRTFTKTFEQEVLSLANEFEKLLENNDIEIDNLTGGSKGLAVFFKRLQALELGSAKDSKFGKAIPEPGKWAAGKLNKAQKETVEAIENQLESMLSAIHEKLDENLPKYSLYRLLDAEILSFALQQRLLDQLDEMSMQSNQVHISEFNKRLASAINDAAVPYIYERLGERYKHFLLDEFQDTSLLQWHNFLPLVENALASNNLSLIVGDAKQAIYRFRSGEVEQFIQLPNIYRKEDSLVAMHAQPTISQHFEAEYLGKNYRSLPAVVRFNNEFYSFLSAQLPEKYQEVYHDLKQEFVPKTTSGLVQIELLDSDTDDEQLGDVFQQRTLEIIQSLHEQKYAYRDMAVLTRARADGVEMARFLSGEQIPVISSESLLVSSSAAVQLLVHSLKYIHRPEDAVVASGLRYYHQLACHATKTEETAIDTFFSAKSVPQPEMEALLGLEKGSMDRTKVAAFSLFDFCEYLIRLYGLDKEADTYLPFFLEAVYNWQNDSANGLAGFLDFWEENRGRIAVISPEDTDAVKIMTIHKAKGLEFPVVIYPNATHTLKGQKTKNNAWVNLEAEQIPGLKHGVIKLNAALKDTSFASLYEEEMEKSALDAINIIYVATTRAVEQLFVLTKKTPKANGIYEQFLQDNERWNDTEGVYQFGNSAGLPRFPTLEDEPEAHIQPMVSSDWSSRMIVAAEPGKLANRAAIHWGRLIHELLAGIIVEADLPRILTKKITEGLITAEDADQLKKMLSELMQDSRLKEAFSAEAVILNEAEMINANGQLLRPDRVAILPEKVILIDYKTGETEPLHQSQIKSYQALIQTLEGKKVEAYLIYLNEKLEIVEC